MLKGIFKKEKEEKEIERVDDFVEFPIDFSEKKERMNIVIERLDDFTDTDRIVRKVRGGSIAIVSIKGLKEKSMDELKHAISKFRTSVAVFDGDIVGVAHEWVILTPPTARVHRG